MKKLLLTISLAAAAMNINAQLVVDSVGRVGIRTGNQTLSSTLTLKNNVNDDTVIYSNVSGIYIEEGGRIKHNKDVNFQIPLGVTLEQNHGTIE